MGALETASARVADAVEHQGASLLLVDDDEVYRLVLAEQLRDAGFIVENI